jgi:type 1 fimbria pilin
MKKILLAAVAVLMMTGASVAAEVKGNDSVNTVTVSVQKQNILDKTIALIEAYTKKIDAAKSRDELQTIVVEMGVAMGAFEKNNGKEADAFEATLTEQQRANYEKKAEAAAKKLEETTKKKMKQFGLGM